MGFGFFASARAAVGASPAAGSENASAKIERSIADTSATLQPTPSAGMTTSASTSVPIAAPSVLRPYRCESFVPYCRATRPNSGSDAPIAHVGRPSTSTKPITCSGDALASAASPASARATAASAGRRASPESPTRSSSTAYQRSGRAGARFSSTRPMSHAPRLIPPIMQASVSAVPSAETPSERPSSSCQMTSHESAAMPPKSTAAWMSVFG